MCWYFSRILRAKKLDLLCHVVVIFVGFKRVGSHGQNKEETHKAVVQLNFCSLQRSVSFQVLFENHVVSTSTMMIEHGSEKQHRGGEIKNLEHVANRTEERREIPVAETVV